MFVCYGNYSLSFVVDSNKKNKQYNKIKNNSNTQVNLLNTDKIDQLNHLVLQKINKLIEQENKQYFGQKLLQYKKIETILKDYIKCLYTNSNSDQANTLLQEVSETLNTEDISMIYELKNKLDIIYKISNIKINTQNKEEQDFIDKLFNNKNLKT